MAERDELLSHNYDGIQEYDNDLPRWWQAMFVLTILYGVFYVGYYHFGPGLLQEEQLAVDMAELAQKQQAHAKAAPVAEITEQQLAALATEAVVLESGKAVYDAKCLACHGPQGQGLVGPNLTDDYWIHGGSLLDIRKIIVVGVPEKGMLAWGPLLAADDITAVTAYISSLRGTNPDNPKKAEGELYQPLGETPESPAS